MGEYASNAKANTAITLASVLGGIGTASALSNGNGGGILSGIFGGGASDRLSALMAENAMLKSENYSDKVGKEVYSQSLADNQATEDRINAILKPTAEAIAENQKQIAVLQMQVAKDQEINELKIKNCCCEMNGKIDNVAHMASCGIQANATAIAGLQATVAAVTKNIIPSTNVWTPPATTTTTTTPAA